MVAKICLGQACQHPNIRPGQARHDVWHDAPVNQRGMTRHHDRSTIWLHKPHNKPSETSIISTCHDLNRLLRSKNEVLLTSQISTASFSLGRWLGTSNIYKWGPRSSSKGIPNLSLVALMMVEWNLEVISIPSSNSKK